MGNIVCFGEVLWDIFPNYKKIGGAPLNVSVRFKAYNNNVSLISAIGNDELGSEILNYLNTNNINTDYIQVLDDYNTGEVQVALNEKGSASYIIAYPSAWDNIKLTESSILEVKKSDVFLFGSLVTRNETSQKTLYKLIEHAKYRVFDLNLRPPHFTKDIVLYLMNEANFIKMNDEELYEVSGLLGSKFNSLEQNLRFVSKKTNTNHICVTKGAFGAVLLYNDKLYYNSGYKIKVADTVGAGDSFLGTLISQLQNAAKPQQAIDFACAVGALVAQNVGANPELSLEEIENFINP